MAYKTLFEWKLVVEEDEDTRRKAVRYRATLYNENGEIESQATGNKTFKAVGRVRADTIHALSNHTPE